MKILLKLQLFRFKTAKQIMGDNSPILIRFNVLQKINNPNLICLLAKLNIQLRENDVNEHVLETANHFIQHKTPKVYSLR